MHLWAKRGAQARPKTTRAYPRRGQRQLATRHTCARSCLSWRANTPFGSPLFLFRPNTLSCICVNVAHDFWQRAAQHGAGWRCQHAREHARAEQGGQLHSAASVKRLSNGTSLLPGSEGGVMDSSASRSLLGPCLAPRTLSRLLCCPTPHWEVPTDLACI